MRNPLKLLAPHNDCTFFCSGNGTLQAQDKSGLFSLTASGSLRYQAANGARINLIKNPRFASNTTNWNGAGGTAAQITNDGVSGSTSLEVACTASAQGPTLDGNNVSTAMLTPPQTVTISFAAKLASGASDWNVLIVQRGGSGANLGQTTQAVTLSAGWTRYVVHYTPSATGVHFITFGLQRASAAAATVRITDVVLEAGNIANPTYFDGSTGGVWLDPITGQLGTAHASPSVSQAAFWVEEGTTNLLINPSAENATLTTGISASNSATITKDSAYAYVGASSVKVVCPGSVAFEGVVFVSAAGLSRVNVTQQFPGQFRIRGSGPATIDAWVRIAYTDSTFTDGSHTTITLSDQWQYVATPIPTSVNTKTIDNIQLNIRTTTAGADTFWVDAAQVDDNKGYATSFSDGSLGTGYTWSGSANASSSTRANTLVTAPIISHVDATRSAIVTWANPTIDSASSRYLVILGGSGSGAVFYGRTSADTSVQVFGTALPRTAGVVVVPANAWSPWYVDWDSGNAEMFANSVKIRNGSYTTPASFNSATITIGGPTNQQIGLIGPVAIFNSPLSDADLAKAIALGPNLSFDSLKALR